MNQNMKNYNKNELRKYAKAFRLEQNIDLISANIYNKLIGLKDFQDAKNILLFYPLGSEIDLTKCFNLNTKNWYLPRVEYKELIIHKYNKADDLMPNKWGILEPSAKSEVIDPRVIDLAVIPALMADKHGYRLGYGAGFYDRFNKFLNNSCIKITCVINELFVENLPFDKWDVPMDYIITESLIRKVKID